LLKLAINGTGRLTQAVRFLQLNAKVTISNLSMVLTNFLKKALVNSVYAICTHPDALMSLDADSQTYTFIHCAPSGSWRCVCSTIVDQNHHRFSDVSGSKLKYIVSTSPWTISLILALSETTGSGYQRQMSIDMQDELQIRTGSAMSSSSALVHADSYKDCCCAGNILPDAVHEYV
jgi:hypothetical protein